MSQFKVGDIVEILTYRTDGTVSPYAGRVGVVLEVGRSLTDRTGRQREDGVRLDISEPKCSFPPERLRLKHIPPDDTHLPADEEFTDWLRKQVSAPVKMPKEQAREVKKAVKEGRVDFNELYEEQMKTLRRFYEKHQL